MPFSKYNEAYKSVKASDALRERILFEAEETAFAEKKSFISVINRKAAAFAAAACAAVIIGVGAISALTSDAGGVSLYYCGSPVGEEAVTIEARGAQAVSFGAKSVTTSGLPLELKIDGRTKISVTDGEMQIFDSETDELLFVGTDFTASENVTVYWNLSDVTEEVPCILVDTEKEYSIYTLEESSSLGYTIRLKEIKTK